MAAGITLKGAAGDTRASLEEAFFAITGTGDAEVADAKAAHAADGTSDDRRSFSSEWVKLRRRSMLMWGLGGMLFFSAIATFFTFQRAVKVHPAGIPRPRRRGSPSRSSRRRTASCTGSSTSSSLFGIVALALFAGATATEYSLGTLRNLLVRQPARVKLLCGKYLALALFVLIALLLAFAVGAVIAFAVGPGKGVDTSAWTSSTGLNDTFQALLHVYLTTLGYGVLGMRSRSSCARPRVAITLGIAYALPGEAISSTLSGPTGTAGCRGSC